MNRTALLVAGQSHKFGPAGRHRATRAAESRAGGSLRSTPATRLALEQLEGRQMLAVDPAGAAADVLPLAAVGDTVLVARDSEWKFLADGSNQRQPADGSLWFAHPMYDDTATGPAGEWPEGFATLGYGDNQTTDVGFIDTTPGDPGNVTKNATTYFRRTLDVTDPTQFNELLVSLQYDDAAAVYLNGAEIVRTPNLPAGAAYDEFATVDTPDENAFFDFLVSADDLVAGTNTIAAEIHQGDAGSSDISFNLELVGRTSNFSSIRTERIATGFSLPLYVVSPPGDAERMFVVEQRSGSTGRIRILNLDTGAVNATPFLSISNVATGNEQGLLGLAFHPQYADNGLFYVNFNVSGGTTHVREYQVSAGNPDVADPASARTILTFSQPQANHNGGWISFGPDGYLYISSGDGGGGNDDDSGHTNGLGNGQDVNTLLGKMLRIDVDGDDFPADANANYAIPTDNPFVGIAGRDEIWAYGLRNPWRPSFDRLTGDLYIADVGQGVREEINFQPAASPGGENYGWRVMEGDRCNFAGDPLPCDDPSFTGPVYDYDHGGGSTQGFSVTGGFVYRGPITALQGKYFFSDFVTERIWSIEHDGTQNTEFIDWTAQFTPDVGTINEITSYGEDIHGNLYIVDRGGEIFRVVAPTVTAARVFYNNSALDGGDPAAGAADDAAIATDKVPLRASGGPATLANYTSYSRGINGVMIDVDRLADAANLTAADFSFRVGNNDDPATWAAAPLPTGDIAADVRPGAGAGGSDRVTLLWPDGAIVNTWLEVTVKANSTTGLTANEVFYFGNAVGESGLGNPAEVAVVNAVDRAAARANPRNFLNPAAADFPFDYNRDTLVDAADRALARLNPTSVLTGLRMISVGSGGAGPVPAGAVADLRLGAPPAEDTSADPSTSARDAATSSVSSSAGDASRRAFRSVRDLRETSSADLVLRRLQATSVDAALRDEALLSRISTRIARRNR